MGGINMIKQIIFIIAIIALIAFCVTRTTSNGNIGKGQKVAIWVGVVLLVAILAAAIIHFIK